MTSARTRAELRAVGWTNQRIDNAIRRGRVVRPHRGVLLPAAATVDFLVRVRAACAAVGPHATVGGETAALLWGLEGLPEATADGPIRLWVPADATVRPRAGIVLKHTTLHADEITILDGIPVTTPSRTVTDLARWRKLTEAVVIADSALRLTACTRSQLLEAAARLRGQRGAVGARRVVQLARARTRSCGETGGRLVIVLGGRPEPEVGIEICSPDGDPIAEADMGYRRWLIWIEYDGFVVHTQRHTFRNDRPRQRLVERRGWFVLRMTDWDVDHPAAILSDLDAAIEDAPRRIAAIPSSRSPEVAYARRSLGLD
jgi:hypothetical protein